MRLSSHLPWVVAALFALCAPAALAARPFQPGAVGFAHRPVCGVAPKRAARCNAQVIVNSNGAPLVAFTPSGYGPGDLQSAYGLTSLASSAGATQTVAIVDAYDAPDAEADMGTYRSQYGLPACTTANGCFRKVDQRGGTSYPGGDAGWEGEISLDLDMVSAICPNCHILLVEADSAYFTDLTAAVDRAALLGATQISNSYGGSEYLGETTDESHYDHPGIAITVSSGDAGYGTEFPASSRYVTAVGGTSLNFNGSAWSESAWSGAGSGCSQYVPKPAWQTDSGCTRRMVADVSAVADPNTGVAVYDGGWQVFGGTSAAAPIVASFDALVGAADFGRSYPYDNPAAFNDVTSGSNGSCGSTYLCTATTGYDGPTGIGTPRAAAPSGSRPTVATRAASALASNSATVNGVVDPNGLDTTYRFEYGTTTAYGSRSPASDQDAGAGSVTVPLSADLTGLQAGTTYHYRVVAISSAGTSVTSDRTFSTTSTPVAATGSASAVADTTATVDGTVDPNGVTTSYHFEYGTTTAYGSQSPDASAGAGFAPLPVTTSLGGLAPGSTYHYRLVAASSAGTSVGVDKTFTTTSKPSVDTQDATAVGTNVATLNGSVNPQGAETTYHFEYGTTSAYGLQLAPVDAGAGSAQVAASAALVGLAPGTTYHFRLVATNRTGTSASADRTLTTATTPTTQTVTGPCAPSLAVKRARRTVVLTVRCAPAGAISAVALRGTRGIVRVRRSVRAPGTASLALVVARRAFARHASLRLTISVTIVDAAGARTVLRRRVTIRR